MSDKELLELAAKAAGIDLSKYEWKGYAYWFFDGEATHFWNPLIDDGDALRLAVKLNMHIQCDFDFLECPCVIVYGDWTSQTEKGNDPYAATRRAVVLAAAETGKVKGE